MDGINGLNHPFIYTIDGWFVLLINSMMDGWFGTDRKLWLFRGDRSAQASYSVFGDKAEIWSLLVAR
jgi:hypothetical protein